VRKKTTRERAFIEKYRDNPKAIAEYLNDALLKGDPSIFIRALGAIVRAQGAAEIAQKTGQHRTTLYSTFRPNRSPAVSTTINILQALNLKISVAPSN
jgi:probable addiction module antidote protein